MFNYDIFERQSYLDQDFNFHERRVLIGTVRASSAANALLIKGIKPTNLTARIVALSCELFGRGQSRYQAVMNNEV